MDWKYSMAREFAKQFYNSARWKKCRSSYISYRRSIDGGMCETCHEVPGYIVHHKEELQPWNINDPDVTLNFDNLKYDCHICHNKENKGEVVEGLADYAFTEDGDVVAPPDFINIF